MSGGLNNRNIADTRLPSGRGHRDKAGAYERRAPILRVLYAADLDACRIDGHIHIVRTTGFTKRRKGVLAQCPSKLLLIKFSHVVNILDWKSSVTFTATKYILSSAFFSMGVTTSLMAELVVKRANKATTEHTFALAQRLGLASLLKRLCRCVAHHTRSCLR